MARSIFEIPFVGDVIRKLVVIMKHLLVSNDVGNVFKGGLSASAQFVMIGSFVLQHPLVKATSISERSVGIIFLDFLKYYGETLDMHELGVGIDLKFMKGFTFNRFNISKNDSSAIYVQDPLNSLSNISQGSFNIHTIRKVLLESYDKLSRNIACYPLDNSILSMILYISKSFMERRKTCDELFDLIQCFEKKVR